MYSCSSDHNAKCWVVEFGDCTRTYKGHKHTIHSLFFQEGLCKFSSNKFLVRESNKCVFRKTQHAKSLIPGVSLSFFAVGQWSFSAGHF